MIHALSDTELEQVGVWTQEEVRERAVRAKQETIARIRDLAAVAGVHIKISGARGRPAKPEPQPKRPRAKIARTLKAPVPRLQLQCRPQRTTSPALGREPPEGIRCAGFPLAFQHYFGAKRRARSRRRGSVVSEAISMTKLVTVHSAAHTAL